MPENPYEAMKTVLLERGWAKKQYMRPDGSVCLLGAAALVDGCAADVFAINSWYMNGHGDEAALGLATLLVHYGVVKGLPSWQDEWERSFDDVMDFLDACALRWKEDTDE